jgi:pimeloyl-ACP methyl ester carboxylesterase
MGRVKMEASTNQLPSHIRAEYPFKNHFFEQPSSKGETVRQHYLDEGEGMPILMLHGNPTWSFYFRNCVKQLSSKGFRCIVPDHIGCGLSDKPQNYPYTLERRIQDIERLMDHLGIEKMHLIVHDWGGAIGMGYAGRYPEKIDRIAILNSGAFLSKHIPKRIAFLRTPWLGSFLMRTFNSFAGPATFMAVHKPLTETAKAGLLYPYRTWQDRIAVARFVQDIPMHPTHPSYECLQTVEANLEHLRVKSIGLFWGEKDFCFNQHFLKRWTEIFPRAQVNRYPEAGHYVLEDAREAILNDLANFF